MAKDCLYCGLQFSDTTTFCPNCGRPTESGFSIRPLQESEVNCLRREVQEKDELIRQLLLTRTQRGEASRATYSTITPDRNGHEFEEESWWHISESRERCGARTMQAVNEEKEGNV